MGLALPLTVIHCEIGTKVASLNLPFHVVVSDDWKRYLSPWLLTSDVSAPMLGKELTIGIQRILFGRWKGYRDKYQWLLPTTNYTVNQCARKLNLMENSVL